MLTSSSERNQLKNSYNLHRQRLVSTPNYGRDLILNSAFIVNPALRITEHINVWIGERLARWRQTRRNAPAQAQNQHQN